MIIKNVGRSSRSPNLTSRANLLPKYLVHEIFKFRNSQKLPNLIRNKISKTWETIFFFFELLGLKGEKTWIFGVKNGNFSQKRLKWALKLTNMYEVIWNEEKSKEIPTITQGVTQGASDSLICSSEAKKRASGAPCVTPWVILGIFLLFSSFPITSYILVSFEAHFQCFREKVPFLTPKIHVFSPLRPYISEKKKIVPQFLYMLCLIIFSNFWLFFN